SNGELDANTIDSLTTTSLKTGADPDHGDFSAFVTLHGHQGKKTLGAVKIAGDVFGSDLPVFVRALNDDHEATPAIDILGNPDWDITGDMGAFTAGGADGLILKASGGIDSITVISWTGGALGAGWIGAIGATGVKTGQVVTTPGDFNTFL